MIPWSLRSAARPRCVESGPSYFAAESNVRSNRSAGRSGPGVRGVRESLRQCPRGDGGNHREIESQPQHMT